ncbi:MAG: J domain-containing protein [Candidatus Doudnabacteria bacterium]|nr:J domain-containing protein [Candidatus Doudnabacteria bacterium]
MNSELSLVAGLIDQAQHPEDVFGTNPGTDPQKSIKRIYAQLARKVHPDFNPAEKVIAERTFAKLSDLHEQAKDRLRAGVYGKRIPVTANKPPMSEVVIKGVYIRYADFAAGDIADIHAARMVDGPKISEVLLKAAREVSDNALLEAERDTLEALRKKLVAKSKYSDWDECLPKVLDSFLLDTGSGPKARINVLEKFEGFYTVEQIRTLIPGGIDGRTLAWMWKRLLLMLDWTHKLGCLHGAVLPPHVMYYPDNDGHTGRDHRKHAVRLIDWCYSRKLTPAAKLIAWSPQWEAFYPPEILAKGTLVPATDLFMGAKTMLYLIGGDAGTDKFPDHIEKEICESFRMCLELDSRRRPQDIKTYFESFVGILERVYGKPKYHLFNLPNR